MALLLLLCSTGRNHSVQKQGAEFRNLYATFCCERHQHACEISRSVMGKLLRSLRDISVCVKHTTRAVFTGCDHVPYPIFYLFIFFYTSRMSANFIPVILLICKTDGWKQTLSTNTYTGDMQCLHKSTSDTQTCKNIQSKMQTQLSHTHSSPPPHLCAL